MPYYKGEKWACYSCTKGHRSSKCTHFDRILYKVRKPGRPLNNCPHVLPDSIPPGTFVNTSSESMANGQPPKEPCNCKNDLVQVAIPKVKSCSCLKPEVVSTIQPTPPAILEQNDGVKKGRIAKRPTARRKKSTVSEEAAEAIRSEVIKVDPVSEKSGTTMDADANGINGVSGDKSGWQGFSGLIDPLPQQQGVNVIKPIPQDHHTNQPFGPPNVVTSGLNNYWPSSASPLVSPAIGSLDHLSLSQNGNAPFSSPTSAFNPPYGHIQNGHSTSGFIDPFPKPQNFYGHVSSNLSTMPQTSVAMFSAQPQYTPISHLNMSMGEKTNGDMKAAAPSAIQPPIASEANVVTHLTQLEWSFIQQARAAGTDLTELSKTIGGPMGFIPLRKPSVSNGNSEDSHSSTANSSYSNSANSSPRATTGSCCSGKIKSPPPPPINSGGCCSGKQRNPEEFSVSNTPGSPRCKCGDACRCVPCADHPHNPAMIEHIRQNMALMEATPQGLYDPVLGRVHSGFSPEGLPYDAYYDDGDDGAQHESMGDLADFVIADYRYGSECRQGNGGCKCGEGCACIGCLTHGGHDGLIVDLSSTTTSAAAESAEGANSSSSTTSSSEHEADRI